MHLFLNYRNTNFLHCSPREFLWTDWTCWILFVKEGALGTQPYLWELHLLCLHCYNVCGAMNSNHFILAFGDSSFCVHNITVFMLLKKISTYFNFGCLHFICSLSDKTFAITRIPTALHCTRSWLSPPYHQKLSFTKSSASRNKKVVTDNVLERFLKSIRMITFNKRIITCSHLTSNHSDEFRRIAHLDILSTWCLTFWLIEVWGGMLTTVH